MTQTDQVTVYPVSNHVIQLRIPTPTLPPSYETNSYIIHDEQHALWVDAGTSDTRLLDAALRVLEDIPATRVIGLVATHYHRDHTHGLPYLQARSRAPIFIHPADLKAARAELSTVSEATLELVPVPRTFEVGGLTVSVEHHPGHTRGHVHILIPDDSVILVGDHLAGDGSVWIGPPDGDMGLYYDALDSIVRSHFETAGPGHGTVLADAAAAASALKQRRLMREEQIFKLASSGPVTVNQILAQLYTGTIPDSALWVARRTITAHLEHLIHLGRIETTESTTEPAYQAIRR